MDEYRDVTPVAGPEAFEERGRAGRLSQAAIVLAAGAAVAGGSDRLDDREALALPEGLTGIERKRKLRVEQAVAPLDIDIATHLGAPEFRIPGAAAAVIARQLLDKPEAVTAAALVEANLHSASRLVRTAAANAALDTTGPREDVLARLEEGAASDDPLIRDLGRVGLARANPSHDMLRRFVGRPSPLSGTDGASHTAVLTHGTFAARSRWWRPGGSMYRYLDGLTPPLHLHDPSFEWTGLYSDGARQLDAQRMADWAIDQGIVRPDVIAHSHGGTVASLATRRGLEIDRLVMLSIPVHAQWFPDFTKVRRIIDIRVKWDLVIIADRGGQRYRAPSPHHTKVEEHVNGWFDHTDTYKPDYWDRHGLATVL